MPEPLVMVHSYRVPDPDAYRAKLPGWFDYIAGGHPRVLHHQVYADGDTVTNVQVHPDVASMQLMMQLFMARAGEWAGLIDLSAQDFLLCGQPPSELVDQMRMGAGDAPLRVTRTLGGFSRLGD